MAKVKQMIMQIKRVGCHFRAILFARARFLLPFASEPNTTIWHPALTVVVHIIARTKTLAVLQLALIGTNYRTFSISTIISFCFGLGFGSKCSQMAWERWQKLTCNVSISKSFANEQQNLFRRVICSFRFWCWRHKEPVRFDFCLPWSALGFVWLSGNGALDLAATENSDEIAAAMCVSIRLTSCTSSSGSFGRSKWRKTKTGLYILWNSK